MNATAHYKRREWVTKEGRVIPVAEMETSHLVNVAKLITRQVAQNRTDEWYDDVEFTEYLLDETIWPHLAAELDKRHIDVTKLVNEHLAANGYSFRLDTTSTPKRFPSEADDDYGLTWPDNL